MKRSLTTLLLLCAVFAAEAQPWKHGRLEVSDNGRYLRHADGTPFFWLADTAWLLPERLDRDETNYYLDRAAEAGFNVVQVQTVNAVPAVNRYGQLSMTDGFDFSKIDREGVYGYWDHMDFVVDAAARRGIYVGMVPIWGGLVKAGKMNEEQAAAYGRFLGERYRERPNIVWIIGGDVRGDVKPGVWHALARAIRDADPNHTMTFHPRGRTLSTEWFNEAEWLDFNMFQSGHRRYGQRNGERDYPIEDNTEEDSWRYVERSLSAEPRRPVVDGEPSYEAIPKGLHDPREGFWQARDVRRYAYWSVFAGAAGHTYGHNSVMQFLRPGIPAAYGATRYWYDALGDEGYNQMKHLKRLMLAFPCFERVAAQELVTAPRGERYERVAATRGTDYALCYTHTGAPFTVELSCIGGGSKKAWWYSPRDGRLTYIGEFRDRSATFCAPGGHVEGNDWVLVITSAERDYVKALDVEDL